MKRIFLLLFVCILFAVSCAPATPLATSTATLTPSQTPTRTRPPTRTPTPSVTPSPSFTPTLTSTPQPTLIAHEWKPEKVVISYTTGSGDGCCTFPRTPPFILFADGTLYLSRYYLVGDFYRKRILVKKGSLGFAVIFPQLGTKNAFWRELPPYEGGITATPNEP